MSKPKKKLHRQRAWAVVHSSGALLFGYPEACIYANWQTAKREARRHRTFPVTITWSTKRSK